MSELINASETFSVCARMRDVFCEDIRVALASIEGSNSSTSWDHTPAFLELVKSVHQFVASQKEWNNEAQNPTLASVSAQAFEQAYLSVVHGRVGEDAKKNPVLLEMIEKAAVELQGKIDALDEEYNAIKGSGQAITTKMSREYDTRRADLSRALEHSTSVEVTPQLVRDFSAAVLQQTTEVAQQLLTIVGLSAEPDAAPRRSLKP